MTDPAPREPDSDVIVRRITARLIDFALVVALFLVIWLPTGLERVGPAGGCELVPAEGCSIVDVVDERNDAGEIEQFLVLEDGRKVSSEINMLTIGSSEYLVALPKESPAAYVVPLAVALLLFVVLQGSRGWTLGKLLTGIRLTRTGGETPGVGRAFVRWLVPDGLIGLVGLAFGLFTTARALPLLALFGALGVVRFAISTIGQPKLISDGGLDLAVLHRDDAAARTVTAAAPAGRTVATATAAPATATMAPSPMAPSPSTPTAGAPAAWSPAPEPRPFDAPRPSTLAPIPIPEPPRTEPVPVIRPTDLTGSRPRTGEPAGDAAAAAAAAASSGAGEPTTATVGAAADTAGSTPSGPVPVEAASSAQRGASDATAGRASDAPREPAASSAGAETPIATEASAVGAAAAATTAAAATPVDIDEPFPAPTTSDSAGTPSTSAEPARTVASDPVPATSTPAGTSPSTPADVAAAAALAGGAVAVATAEASSAEAAYQPQWDPARRAYICWEPGAGKWMQWDDAANTWGPISQ